MKLQNMFKKTSVRAHYISLKNARPEVPAGLLRKCNKCGAAIIAEDVKKRILYLSEMPRVFPCPCVQESGDAGGRGLL